MTQHEPGPVMVNDGAVQARGALAVQPDPHPAVLLDRVVVRRVIREGDPEARAAAAVGEGDLDPESRLRPARRTPPPAGPQGTPTPTPSPAPPRPPCPRSNPQPPASENRIILPPPRCWL